LSGGPFCGKRIGVTIIPRAVVINVTVVVAAFDPAGVVEDGETPQLAPGADMVQLQSTVRSNPFMGAAEIVKLACCPALIVPLLGEAETP
jgi:hypothetical protein